MGGVGVVVGGGSWGLWWRVEGVVVGDFEGRGGINAGRKLGDGGSILGGFGMTFQFNLYIFYKNFRTVLSHRGLGDCDLGW